MPNHSLEAIPAVHRRGLFEDMLGPLEILAKIDPDDLPRWNPPLDRARLRWELAGFELWYRPSLCARSHRRPISIAGSTNSRWRWQATPGGCATATTTSTIS